MGRINVNTSVLEKTARNLKNLAGEANDTANLLNQTKDIVNSSWKSKYTGLYIEEMETVQRNICKLQEEMQLFAKRLERQAAEIRRVEEENQKTFIS